MALKTYSTIPFIADALKAAFATRPKLSDVLIVDGPPAAGEYPAPEWVALLDVRFRQEAHAMNVSARPRHERYTQNVLVTVVRTSQRSTGSSERAWELFAELERAIRDNPTLTAQWTKDGQIVSVQVGEGVFSKRASGEERESAISFGLDVHARI